MQVWNVLHATRCKCRTQKIAKKSPWAPSHNFVGLYLRNWGMYRQSEKNLLRSNISSTCPHNMVNFGPLAAEIVALVWGIPANFNRFRVLAALLHGTVVVGVSQTLRRWTEGATYIRQGGHHVGHWLTFVVIFNFQNAPMEPRRARYYAWLFLYLPIKNWRTLAFTGPPCIRSTFPGDRHAIKRLGQSAVAMKISFPDTTERAVINERRSVVIAAPICHRSQAACKTRTPAIRAENGTNRRSYYSDRFSWSYSETRWDLLVFFLLTTLRSGFCGRSAVWK